MQTWMLTVHILWVLHEETTDFSLIQARSPIQQQRRHDTSPCIVDCICIKWAWLRSLAVHDRSFALKRGIKLVRLSFTAVYQVTYWSYIDYSKFSPHKPGIWAAISRAATHGCIPYSGKLSREKTHKFREFSTISESFFREIWGVAYLKS